MPSQSVLEQKKAIVADLTERLKNSITGVVVCYEGINTEDDTKLRKELRENDVKYTVVKNTLLSRACDEAGLEELKPVLEGTTALATSDSEYALNSASDSLEKFMTKKVVTVSENEVVEEANAVAQPSKNYTQSETKAKNKYRKKSKFKAGFSPALSYSSCVCPSFNPSA